MGNGLRWRQEGMHAGMVLVLVLFALVTVILLHLRGGAHTLPLGLSGSVWLLGLGLVPLAVLLWHLWQQESPLLKALGWLLLAGLHLYFIMALPHLSDDVYRFLWDGHLLAAGHHPFAHIPAWYMEHPEVAVPGITEALYLQLNSPEYFSIYPPLNQLLFWLSAVLGQSTEQGIVIIRLAVIAASLGNVWLLRGLLPRFGLPRVWVLLYALHPMVLLEFTLNLHFEVFLIFFLLLSIRAWKSGHWVWSAVWLALSVLSKLSPLIFLPLLFFRLGWKRSLCFYAIVGGVVLLGFLPLLDVDLLLGMRESVGLYFQKFEFNASIYYLARWLGFELVGYNVIQTLGPWLGIFTFAGILLFSFLERGKKSLPEAMLWVLLLFLAMSTTVHPWYISTLMVLGLLSGWRFPLVWSLTVFISYAGYDETGYTIPWLGIWLEYLIVLVVLLWELWHRYTYDERTIKSPVAAA